MKQRDPNLQSLPMQNDDAKRIRDALRKRGEIDEMFMRGDSTYDSMSPTQHLSCLSPPVIHLSTPSGRNPTCMEDLLRRMQDAPKFAAFGWETEPLIPIVGMENVKRHYLARDGAMPLIIADERHCEEDQKIEWGKLLAHIDSITRTSLGLDKMRGWQFDFDTPDYTDLHKLYTQEHSRSKIKDEDARHEAICKVILQPHKKRRKAIRKMLDRIGGELKRGNGNSEGDASDNV